MYVDFTQIVKVTKNRKTQKRYIYNNFNVTSTQYDFPYTIPIDS